MIQYYIELINKPRYMLTEAEKMYIDVFPYLLVGAVVLIIYAIITVVSIIHERRNKK